PGGSVRERGNAIEPLDATFVRTDGRFVRKKSESSFPEARKRFRALLSHNRRLFSYDLTLEVTSQEDETSFRVPKLCETAGGSHKRAFKLLQTNFELFQTGGELCETAVGSHKGGFQLSLTKFRSIHRAVNRSKRRSMPGNERSSSPERRSRRS